VSGPSSNRAVARFFGSALMVIGGIVLALSGLCTGLGVLFGIVGALSAGGSDAGLYFVYVLVLGGPPIIVALAMFFLGRWIVRRNATSTTVDPTRDQR
jgi:ribose/xylose/arabinose/galactoside ABC-type transport system permease subunit